MSRMALSLEGFWELEERNAHIVEPGLKLYVRRSYRHGIDIEIGSVDARKPGNGAFTEFLDKYEERFTFYIENVLNERFFEYLQRRGYVDISTPELDMKIPCMIKKVDDDRVGRFTKGSIASKRGSYG